MTKPSIPEMQNPNRAHANVTKTIEKASLRLSGDTAAP